MSFVHANDAAMGNLGYERRDADFYPTPEWATEAVIPTLLSIHGSNRPVWEPACGTGEMARVLSETFTNITSTDLHDYGFGQSGVDFLALPDNHHWKGAIVTNPPYGDLAEAFVRKALKLTRKHQGTVAMLLRNEYDSAKERVDLFNARPFFRKLVLTSRPRWIPGSTGAPRHNYSWFIWFWGSTEERAGVSYHVRGRK